MSKVQELLRAAGSGSVIECKVRPAEGTRVVFSPRQDLARDPLPWILEGQQHDWARYRSREVGVR
ncbi:hypothetical protein ACFYXW_27565 [Streptomyces sp. NPDC001981]|uniref:hypothetical protein n=1 Tax=Streptomyces sp. NPDC001981 TaxID=3364628 RepID=UPI0036CE6975